MDDQHAILMDELNELRLAVVRGSGREQVASLSSAFRRRFGFVFFQGFHTYSQGFAQNCS